MMFFHTLASQSVGYSLRLPDFGRPVSPGKKEVAFYVVKDVLARYPDGVVRSGIIWFKRSARLVIQNSGPTEVGRYA